MIDPDDGGPAFPEQIVRDGDGLWVRANSLLDGVAGMSLRDYFAGQALAGLASITNSQSRGFGYIVDLAYRYADAMLEHRYNVAMRKSRYRDDNKDKKQ